MSPSRLPSSATRRSPRGGRKLATPNMVSRLPQLCCLWFVCLLNLQFVTFISASFLKTMVSDNNAGALDAGLDATLAFLNVYEEDICPLTGSTDGFQVSFGLGLCTAVIEKGFSSNKASCINK